MVQYMKSKIKLTSLGTLSEGIADSRKKQATCTVAYSKYNIGFIYTKEHNNLAASLNVCNV